MTSHRRQVLLQWRYAQVRAVTTTILNTIQSVVIGHATSFHEQMMMMLMAVAVVMMTELMMTVVDS